MSPAGHRPIGIALGVLTVLDEQLARLRRELITTAHHLSCAKVLAARLYWVGPITGLARRKIR